MTYCLAIKVEEGLVFASDSRTNAGLDNIGTYTKMFTYNVGDRAFVILTAGNLATSQAVYHQIEKDLENSNNESEMPVLRNAIFFPAFLAQTRYGVTSKAISLNLYCSVLGIMTMTASSPSLTVGS